MSFRESTNAARANIHVRGDFLRRGEEVSAGTPKVLNPLLPRAYGGPASRRSCVPAASEPATSLANRERLAAASNGGGETPVLPCADRLDLARWIVDPANPLTARVAVNHVWLHLLGRGLVATTEDFGTRGERPSHPELLDWLAVSFSTSCSTGPRAAGADVRNQESGVQDDQMLQTWAVRNLAWSRKALIKLIVTSATYRQSSNARPDLQQRDPQNVLLARQSRFRLESEIIRDLCLAAGGLLNPEIGGPSFRPYLPDDVKKLGTAGAFSWTDSDGPEKYRRGLYIFAQRTVPYPTAMTLDQADPTQTCTRRERSDTPLQALTLLNHGIFVECAQGLAKRLAESPTASPREKIEQGFEFCLSRKPSRLELDRLEGLYRDLRTPKGLACLTHEAGGALAGSAPAGAATWVEISQVLLNLDEFLTRE
jgi:hypothetical protein